MAKTKKEQVSEVVSVNPIEASELIKHCMKHKSPVMVWGPPGIGKSDIVFQIGESYKEVDEDGNILKPARPIIDIRLLLHDPTDLKGMPYFDFNEGRMKWSQPSELPMVVSWEQVVEAEEEAAKFQTLLKDEMKKETPNLSYLGDLRKEANALQNKANLYRGAWGLQNAIIFLDELVAAPQTVQGAAYQLILNRKIGEYTLPAGVDIVAAGNRETDRGVSFRMPKPLQNRFIHLSLESSFEDWRKWAIHAGVQPDVIGFLQQNPQHLFNFDPKSASNAFPTPRSWKKLSDILCDQFTGDAFYPLAAGTVGDGMAVEFMAHRKVSTKMPNPLDIIMGVHKEKLKVQEISALYSLVISMSYRLNEKYLEAVDNAKGKKKGNSTLTMDQVYQYVENYFAYLLDNFQPEMCVLGAKIILNEYKIKFSPKDMKAFRMFYDKYGHLVVG
jgi:MoxR-like ATPase